MCGNRPACWMEYPILRRSSVGLIDSASTSPMRIRPDVGSDSRLIIRIIVVFPQPDGPTNTTISPAGMSSDASSTAGSVAPG